MKYLKCFEDISNIESLKSDIKDFIFVELEDNGFTTNIIDRPLDGKIKIDGNTCIFEFYFLKKGNSGITIGGCNTEYFSIHDVLRSLQTFKDFTKQYSLNSRILGNDTEFLFVLDDILDSDDIDSVTKDDVTILRSTHLNLKPKDRKETLCLDMMCMISIQIY